jgi:hypothetical protein
VIAACAQKASDMRNALLIVGAALWLPTITHAEMICKYVDTSGNLHYTNTIPQPGWTLQTCGVGAAEPSPKPTATGPSSEWMVFYRTPVGLVYVKPDTIHRDGAFTKAWFMYDFATPQKTTQPYPPKSYNSAKVLERIDCARGTLGEAQEVLYGDALGSGEVVHTMAWPTPELTEAVPDTVSSQMVQQVCSRPTRDDEKTPRP